MLERKEIGGKRSGVEKTVGRRSSGEKLGRGNRPIEEGRELAADARAGEISG